jgi:hypothetical protein
LVVAISLSCTHEFSPLRMASHPAAATVGRMAWCQAFEAV